MAGSLFDTLQKRVFNTTLRVYGYSATWTPTNGGPVYTGLCHFQNPTQVEQTAGPAQYPEPQWRLEYFNDQFPGLLESVNAAQVVEVVIIDGTSYQCRSAMLDFDGKTVKIELNPTPDA